MNFINVWKKLFPRSVKNFFDIFSVVGILHWVRKKFILRISQFCSLILRSLLHSYLQFRKQNCTFSQLFIVQYQFPLYLILFVVKSIHSQRDQRIRIYHKKRISNSSQMGRIIFNIWVSSGKVCHSKRNYEKVESNVLIWAILVPVVQTCPRQIEMENIEWHLKNKNTNLPI